MKLSGRCGMIVAAALWVLPSMAQQSPISSRYEEFLAEKPPLQLTDPQRKSIIEAVVVEHTHQRTPKDFQPQVGMKVDKAIQSHPMPRPLIYEIPALREYYYAKLDRNVLVIDPMDQKVVDVLAQKWPSIGSKPLEGAEWAATRGRELIGLQPEMAPETTGSSAPSRATQ
jgi:hypothetical protein